VGGRIKVERIRQGLTLQDVAGRVGVTPERIRQVERSNSLNVATIHRFAKVLGVSIDYLLENTSELDPTYHDSKGSLKERLERLERFEAVLNGGA
jgi:transcriptional regulator with XRE-family HTH domain